VPHRDGKGQSGTARLPGRYSLVPSGAEQSGSRVNIPGQNWDFEFMGFKGFFWNFTDLSKGIVGILHFIC
jgi:hypothetical protein